MNASESEGSAHKAKEIIQLEPSYNSRWYKQVTSL